MPGCVVPRLRMARLILWGASWPARHLYLRYRIARPAGGMALSRRPRCSGSQT